MAGYESWRGWGQQRKGTRTEKEKYMADSTSTSSLTKSQIRSTGLNGNRGMDE